MRLTGSLCRVDMCFPFDVSGDSVARVVSELVQFDFLDSSDAAVVTSRISSMFHASTR